MLFRLKLLLVYVSIFLVIPQAVPHDSTMALAKADEKPIIGINTDVKEGPGQPTSYRILFDYVEAIRRSGGIPLLIPPMPEADIPAVLEKVDGIVMIGGNDYPPSLYKQEQHKTVDLMADERTRFDLALVKAVLAKGNIPFLGICAGCQALNIGSGGSLVQDIPSKFPDSKVKHASPQGFQVGFNKHLVKPEPGSKIIAKAIGENGITVVTSHHQAVDKVGDGLMVTARSEDGIVEAIESKDKDFVVGVQWHPERSYDDNVKLFRQLIERGRQFKQSRLASK